MLKRLNSLSLKLVNKNLPGFGLSRPNSTELKNINEIKNLFEKQPIIDTKNLTGASLQWSKHMNELRYLILNRDPREFLAWKVIRFTMFLEYADYLIEELNYLKSLSNFKTKWDDGLIESSFGNPKPYFNFERTSGNLLHHVYHFARFEEKSKVTIDGYDFVFEFGGGYGSMCRLVHNIGFNNKYLIFDLPHFSALQSYYLKSLGYNVLTKEKFLDETSGIVCISDISDLKLILENINLSDRKMLSIATWSLSETPLNLRSEVEKILPPTSHFLIGYQHQFEEVDNQAYFESFQKNYIELKWYKSPIAHLPGSSYLFGY